MATAGEAEANISTACSRCDHEFEVAIALLAAGAELPCPRCGHASDPFDSASEESIVVEEDGTSGPPPSARPTAPPPLAIAGTCAACRKGIDVIPDQMLGKVALCDTCREAIEMHLGKSSGKSTTPFKPSTPLLAEARRSKPPGRY